MRKMVYIFLSVMANYVSLPGAGTTQPTILQELNRVFVPSHNLQSARQVEVDQGPEESEEEKEKKEEKETEEFVTEILEQDPGPQRFFIESSDRNVIIDEVVLSDVHGQSIQDENKSEKSEGVIQQGRINSETVSVGDGDIERTVCEIEKKFENLSKSIDQTIVSESLCKSHDQSDSEEKSLNQKSVENTPEIQSANDQSNKRGENQKSLTEIESKFSENTTETIRSSQSELNFEIHQNESDYLDTQSNEDNEIRDFLEETIIQENSATNTEEILNPNIDKSEIDESVTQHLKPIDVDEICSSISSEFRKYNPLPPFEFDREISPPPVPPVTYKWEDIRRAKEKGGYPWTYLDDPEIRYIKRQRQLESNSPKLAETFEEVDLAEPEKDKPTAIDVAEAATSQSHEENIKTEIEETENIKEPTESRATSMIKGILKRAHPKKIEINSVDDSSQPSDNSPKKTKCCHPFVDKLKTMADKHLSKAAHVHQKVIKKVHLKDDQKIVFEEPQAILRLKESPKADRKEIASYIVKQDSDDNLDIVDLEESPSETRRRREEQENRSGIVIPDEIIELSQEHENEPNEIEEISTTDSIEPKVAIIIVEEVKNDPPPKAPRKKKLHVYEDIDDQTLLDAINKEIGDNSMATDPLVADFLDNLLLKKEDESCMKELHTTHLDDKIQPNNLLQAHSSIDSASSDEDRKAPIKGIAQISTMDSMSEDEEKKEHLAVLQEESDQASDIEGKMSTVEDEPHREDIDLPGQININDRWSKISDHEYEPIGEPVTDSTLSNSITVAIAEPQNDDVSPSKTTDDENTLNSNTEELTTKPKLLRSTEIDEIEMVENIGNLQQQNQQYEADASTSVAVDEPVPESESRMKSFLANANHKRKHMNQQLKTQAGKIQTKLKGMKKTKSESPKKTKRKFKAPEFSKLKSIQVPKIKKPEFKRPEFKRPDFKRLEFKRPELTKLKTFEKLGTLKKSDFKFSLPDRPKFSKPEMPKFNISDRFSSFRLHRSKSVKSTHSESAAATGTSTTEDQTVTVPKKRFDFSTYPRIFDRKKKPKPSERDDARDDDTTDSRPQLAMATRVIKKGSPIPTGATTSSFADTESGQFQQYERDSHSLSRDRSPSLDRRMRLDKQDSLNSEEPKEIQTEEQKQFADYDEENRTIHEISKLREHEFRQRKPFVHQESDLVSEESTKDFGWEESEKLRNHQREESESLSQKEDYSTEAIPDRDRDRLSTQEAQSTGSFKKGVIEEIDDDEFFLRKKGISQDDIQIGQYISSAIREGLDTPENALAKLGQYDPYYDEDFDVNNDRPDYGYDVPPSKPRRVKDFKHLETDSFNDDDLSLRYNDDMQDDELFKTFPPKRPLRKSRRQYSNESLEQNNEVPVAAEYYPHPDEDDGSLFEQEHDHNLRFDETLFATIGHGKLDNDFDIDDATVVKPIAPPRAPKRRKKFKGVVIQDQLEDQGRNAMVNGHVNEVLLYRAEHEYIVPLAQPEKMSTPTLASRSRSQVSHITDDDRTSHGADSLAFDDNKFIINIQENNGYAVVKKEPPPRPPAPIRRKRSTRSLGDRQLVTVRRDQNDWDVEHFQRNTRNYSTVGPTRPPRRISVDLDNSQKWLSVSNSDVTQYEEIDDFDKNVEMKKLAHDDVLNKMKYRPLPPPPRPPRERKPKKFPGEPSEEFGDNKKQTAAVSVPIDSTEEDFASDTLNRLSSQEVEEVEASTQTDPLPDDFLCEEFEISDDMKIIEPTIYRKSKTLEDILKEEQQAELERAKQIADEHCLTKSLYKFKEANQKSQSERSRGSTSDRPKTPGSRPITPSAIVIERKTVLPTTETDAKLIVRPIEEPLEEVQSDTNIPDDIKYSEDIVDTEDERIVNEALRRYTFFDEDLRDSSPTFDETERFPILDGGEPVTHRGSTPPTLTVNPSSPVRRTPPSIPITRALTPPVIRPTENSPPPVPDDESIIETEHEQSPPIADEPFDSDANIQKIEAEEAPQPPPRRKSSTTDFGTSQTNQIAEMPIIEELRDRVTPIYPDPPVDLIQQNRMQITDLDVQHLNVNTIQAGRIAVSDLQAAAVNSVDLECKSGDLVVKSIQLPPGFMDELIERIREKEQELKSNQTKTENESAVKTESAVQQESLETQEQPPRPPPPRFDPSEYTSYSIPPPSFFQLRDYDEDLEPPHVPATRRRRHHRRRELSTSEDDHPSRHTPSRPVDPSVLDLTGQLLRACGRSAVETGSKLLNMVKDRSVGKDGKIEANKEVIIIIIVILALMMLSLSSERTVHYHHWDYFNPPDSSASK